MSTDLLSNTAALTLDTTRNEIVRHYQVTIHKPGLHDDDGNTIQYTVEVTLRYDPIRAEKRPATSYLAHAEAGRRACKLERMSHTTPDNQSLYVDPEVDVTFTRGQIRPARAAA